MKIIKSSISSGAKSDITGRKINRSQIVINILSIKFRKDEIEEVNEMMLEKLDKENVSVKEKSPNNSCIKCGKEHLYVFLYTESNPYPEIGFCKKCTFEILDEIKEQRNLIESMQKYVDECGFSIIDWSGAENQRTDSIDGNKIGDKTVIIINANGKEIITKLENIEELVKVLKTDSKNMDDEKIRSNRSFLSECNFCREDKEIEYICGVALCEECRNKLGFKIEEYLEEEKEFVISHSI